MSNKAFFDKMIENTKEKKIDWKKMTESNIEIVTQNNNELKIFLEKANKRQNLPEYIKGILTFNERMTGISKEMIIDIDKSYYFRYGAGFIFLFREYNILGNEEKYNIYIQANSTDSLEKINNKDDNVSILRLVSIVKEIKTPTERLMEDFIKS